MKLHKPIRTLAALTIAAVLGLGVFVGYTYAHSNLHVVSPGRLYRSGQMDAAALNRVIAEDGIKTIINLRGASSGEDWYQTEMSAAKSAGIQHYDFALSAGREVSDEELETILTTIHNAAKPVLIHCKTGADRTGLLSALYLYRLEGKSADLAGRELTIFNGHFPYLFWRNTSAMDRTFARFVSAHSPSPSFVTTPASLRSATPPVKQEGSPSGPLPHSFHQ